MIVLCFVFLVCVSCILLSLHVLVFYVRVLLVLVSILFFLIILWILWSTLFPLTILFFSRRYYFYFTICVSSVLFSFLWVYALSDVFLSYLVVLFFCLFLIVLYPLSVYYSLLSFIPCRCNSSSNPEIYTFSLRHALPINLLANSRLQEYLLSRLLLGLS